MLHNKFRGNQPAGSREDLGRVFTIYGHGGHLDHVTSIILIYIFISMYLKLYIQILVQMAKWFLRKECFNFHM